MIDILCNNLSDERLITNTSQQVLYMNFQGNFLLTSVTMVFLSLALGIAALTTVDHLPAIAYYFMLIWTAAPSYSWPAAIGSLSADFYLACWVLWSLANCGHLQPWTVELIFFAAFLCALANFIYCAAQNLRQTWEIQACDFTCRLAIDFIRLYIGLNFCPSLYRKTIAGSAPIWRRRCLYPSRRAARRFFCFARRVVWIWRGHCLDAGIHERALAQLARFCIWLFATFLGHHFTAGFIWAGPGVAGICCVWMVLDCQFCSHGVSQILHRSMYRGPI